MENIFANNSNSSQNFFSSASEEAAEQNSEPNSLKSQYEYLKSNYDKIFIEAAESIRREINQFRPDNPCANCDIKDCKVEKKDVFSEYPTGCKYIEWQKQVITFLSGDYRQKLKNIHKDILEARSKYTCNRCASCCRLAVSEYSYTQLKQRASRGDKYSEEFISVFVPYEKEEDAKKANPEYFKLLEDTMEDAKVYYYYCPKLEGNLCSDYENRPGICRDFPHNPLKLLPCDCSYNAWKDEVAHQSLLLKAKVDIIAYYKERLG